MVEVLGRRSAAAASKAADILNDTDVQTSLIGAAIAGATTFAVSGAATKESIKAVFDDIIDLSLFTPIGNVISAIMPNAAVQGTMVASSMLAGLSIGERITDVVLNDSMFDETGHLKPEAKMTVTVAAAAISGACVYLAPKIADMIQGKSGFKLGDLKLGEHLDDADAITSILIKIALGYAVCGAAYAYYGRMCVADANADGKCTQAEYENWVDNIDGIGGIFKPAVAFFKPIVAALPGFDLVE